MDQSVVMKRFTFSLTHSESVRAPDRGLTPSVPEGGQRGICYIHADFPVPCPDICRRCRTSMENLRVPVDLPGTGAERGPGPDVSLLQMCEVFL